MKAKYKNRQFRYGPLALVVAVLIASRYQGRAQDIDEVRPQLVLQIGHSSYIRDIAFSPDGEILATASPSDSTVKLWDIGTSSLLRTLRGYTQGLAFSPDGNILASGSGCNVPVSYTHLTLPTNREV